MMGYQEKAQWMHLCCIDIDVDVDMDLDVDLSENVVE
jgi:hypothetical protein